MALPKKIELGMEVKDRISGFTGIAVSRAVYLQGCNRIQVQPKSTEEGTRLPEPLSFDEPDLEVIGWGILPVPEVREPKTGGPRPFPTKR